jgi:hypothetical protein
MFAAARDGRGRDMHVRARCRAFPQQGGGSRIAGYLHPRNPPMIVRVLAVAVALAVATPVFAQQPAPSAPPTHNCTKPGEHPGRLATDARRAAWAKSANAYIDCLKKFISEQQAIAKPLFDQAKPHADAANAAIEEHNKAVVELKEEQDRNR